MRGVLPWMAVMKSFSVHKHGQCTNVSKNYATVHHLFTNFKISVAF